MDDDLVPLDKVLDDMYNPDGGMVSLAAKEYYMIHYASKEEREAFRRKEERQDCIWKIARPIVIALPVLYILSIVAKWIIALF